MTFFATIFYFFGTEIRLPFKACFANERAEFKGILEMPPRKAIGRLFF